MYKVLLILFNENYFVVVTCDIAIIILVMLCVLAVLAMSSVFLHLRWLFKLEVWKFMEIAIPRKVLAKSVVIAHSL